MAIQPKNDTAIKVDTISEKTASAEITISDKLLLQDSPRLNNNLFLIARNAANSANVNLLKLNASDIIEIGDNLSWQTWVPTYTQPSTMTFTSVTTVAAKYAKIGKLVFFNIHAAGTTGGTATASIRFSLPITRVASVYTSAAGVTISDGGAIVAAGCVSYASATELDVYRYDGAVWGLGAKRTFIVNGVYEAA